VALPAGPFIPACNAVPGAVDGIADETAEALAPEGNGVARTDVGSAAIVLDVLGAPNALVVLGALDNPVDTDGAALVAGGADGVGTIGISSINSSGRSGNSS
jgi:hypothetical protein